MLITTSHQWHDCIVCSRASLIWGKGRARIAIGRTVRKVYDEWAYYVWSVLIGKHPSATQRFSGSAAHDGKKRKAQV
ncbi:hypothetical protein EYC80_008327 [Monilinia laxa]|uniref:Uncharacterized protein n=1 Tax=Monilinia laxa TaxID=61186 RepID=A0A5N6JQJ6_MONLA|nr:hypothetical protein EYC80_008327 [Monilinia laxa]